MHVNDECVVLVGEDGHDLVAEDGRPRTMGKMDAHLHGARHKAISVFLFDSRGRLLLQRRPAGKYHSGGRWTNTCCSHPRPNETPIDAAGRRLMEEMGLQCPLRGLLKFSYCEDVGDGLIENEYDHVFVGQSDDQPEPNPGEVSEWKWMGPRELLSDLAANPESYSVWLRHCLEDVLRKNRA